MQLITILLSVVGILTFLSGAIVFFGSLKSNRTRSAWYFAAAIFATLWMLSISFFLSAKPTDMDVMSFHVNWTFVSAIMLDATFLGFGAWDKKYGKIATLVFLIAGLILSTLILVNPAALYSEIIMNNNGNSIVINYGSLYFGYIIYFCLVVPVITMAFFRQYYKARSKRNRNSNLIAMVAFGISSVITVISNLILPLFGNWSMIWLGPLAIATVILMIYYIILRYQAVNLSLRWLKIFSYIVVVASIAIVYMIVFSIVFAALFRGSTPSMEVIALNFIMILIFIALIPAMNGLVRFIRSLILEQHPSHKKKGNKKA